MKITIVTLRIRPEKVALYETTFRELREKVRANEPGTTFFEVCRDPQEPGVYRVFEAYADADALPAHLSTDYYHETAAIFITCLAGDHLAEIARLGVTDPREKYKLVKGMGFDRFETI